ncbi:MAG: GNAT family N-acetyltransferase [Bacteroidia bacterium]|nr:GNAT family N-acetyltransferase [Bacteroidia bacterium]
MVNWKIEKAIASDADEITELTIRSKDYWHYGEKQIAEWRDELTITPGYITENEVYKIVDGDQILGFYAYQPENDIDIKLNFLFIEPAFIGRGLGKLLLQDFFKRIEKTDHKRVLLDADPNAEQFYKRFGFKVIGQLETSIENRFLPIMELTKPFN